VLWPQELEFCVAANENKSAEAFVRRIRALPVFRHRWFGNSPTGNGAPELAAIGLAVVAKYAGFLLATRAACASVSILLTGRAPRALRSDARAGNADAKLLHARL
jgi:hypothetical protein